MSGATPRRPRRGLVLLLSGLTAAGPLSTDLYLACFPDLIAHLGADAASTQATLSAFFVAFGFTGLLLGPLSDRFGRRPVLLAGFSLYLVASLACAVAPTIGALIALRALQGAGAATGPVIARAVVRDLMSGPEAARVLSAMAAIMGVVPAVAPSLGALVLGLGGWRGEFLVMAAIAAVAISAILPALPETLRQEHRQAISPGRLVGNYAFLLRQRPFILAAITGSASFSGLFAFISASSLIFQTMFGLGPAGFAVCFGAVVFGFIAGTTTGARLVGRLGSPALIRIGGVLVALGGLSMAAATAHGGLGIAGILAPMTLYSLGNGLVTPQCGALAIMPYPRLAGTASALQTAFQLSVSAVVGTIVARFLETSPWPLAITVAITGTLACALTRLIPRAPATPPA